MALLLAVSALSATCTLAQRVAAPPPPRPPPPTQPFVCDDAGRFAQVRASYQLWESHDASTMSQQVASHSTWCSACFTHHLLISGRYYVSRCKVKLLSLTTQVPAMWRTRSSVMGCTMAHAAGCTSRKAWLNAWIAPSGCCSEADPFDVLGVAQTQPRSQLDCWHVLQSLGGSGCERHDWSYYRPVGCSSRCQHCHVC